MEDDGHPVALHVEGQDPVYVGWVAGGPVTSFRDLAERFEPVPTMTPDEAGRLRAWFQEIRSTKS